MKLLIFTPFAERLGGSDNILWSYLQHIDRSRVDPAVVFRGDGKFRREVAELGIRTHVIPEGRLRYPHRTVGGVYALSRIMRADRPDLVLNWLSTAQVYGASAATLAGMADRVIWWQLDLDRGGRLDRVRAMTKLASALPAVAVGTCSETIAESERKRKPNRPAYPVLPGIDAQDPGTEAVEAAREQAGIPPDMFVVGIVGRLFEWKGQDNLIRAVGLLRDRGVPAHALVVGGGGHRADLEYERRLRDLAAEIGPDAVSFTGQVSDASPFLPLMDVFVNASRAEPFGLVLLEAMAAGVAVVAVNAAGPSEIVEPGKSGLLTRSNSPEDLADAIHLLWSDRDQRRRVAAAGRERFQARFTAEVMSRQMDDLLVGFAREVAAS